MDFIMNAANTASRPVIGISGSSSDSASVKAMMKQMEEAGATPMLLANHGKRDVLADIKKIDALVVLGNNKDIDPSEWGDMSAQHPKTKSELLMDDGKTPDHDGIARRSYEFAILEAAMKQRMPVMGVCGGMQRINVMCGGNLHQHVPDLIGHDEHAQQDYKIAPSTPVQPIILAKNTTLSDIASGITTVFSPSHAPVAPSVILENSMHHQAVNVVGEGLRPVAFAEDKVKLPDGRESLLIEAVEADPKGKFGNQLLLGVQWHPEFGASPLGERLANRVATAAKAFAVEHNRTHAPEEVARENMLSSLPQTIPAPRIGSMTDMILRQRASSNPTLGMAL